MGPDQGGDGVEAARLGMGQRGHAIAVGKARIGPGFQQHGDNLLVGRAAVGQDDRLQQRGPAKPVDMVEFGASLDQDARDLDEAALAGWIRAVPP